MLRKTLWMACALTLVGTWVYADTVELKTGLTLEGRVLEDPKEDFIIVMVYNNTGRVKIARSQIKNIDYDFATRLQGITDDDTDAIYKLAKWAMSKGKYPQALDLLEKLKGKDNAPPDLLKLIGQCYDQRSLFDRAFESYQDYAKLHPEDEEVKARLEELGKKYSKEALEAKLNKPVANGYEALMRWSAEQWKDKVNPSTVSSYTNPGDGNIMVLVQTPGGDKDKIAVRGDGKSLDLTESKEIIFRFFHNGATPARVAIAFMNKNNQFFETREVLIPPNAWTDKAVPVAGSVYKSSKNGFQSFTEPMDGADNVTKVMFLIYGQHEMTAYIDSIYFR